MHTLCLSFKWPTLKDACTCRNRYRPAPGRVRINRLRFHKPSTNIQKKLVRWKYLRRTWRMQLMVERFVRVPFLSWNITMKCWNIKS